MKNVQWNKQKPLKPQANSKNTTIAHAWFSLPRIKNFLTEIKENVMPSGILAGFFEV
jgi:hypothetical protein